MARVICPLTNAVPAEPVFLFAPSGRTFERRALEQRLWKEPNVDPSTGKTCPMRLEFAPIVRVSGGGGGDEITPAKAALERQFPGVGGAVYDVVAASNDGARGAAASRLLAACKEAPEHKNSVRLLGGVAALVQVLRDAAAATTSEASVGDTTLLESTRAILRADPGIEAIAAGAVSATIVLVDVRDARERDNTALVELWTRLAANGAYAAALVEAETTPLVSAVVGIVKRGRDEASQILAAQAILTIVTDSSFSSSQNATNERFSGGGDMEPLVDLWTASKTDEARDALAKALAKCVVKHSKVCDISPLVWLVERATTAAPGSHDVAMRALVRAVSQSSIRESYRRSSNVRPSRETVEAPPTPMSSSSSSDLVMEDTIDPLVWLLITGGGRDDNWGVKEAAALGLWRIGKHSAAMCADIVDAGALPALVRLVDRGETDGAKAAGAKLLSVVATTSAGRDVVSTEPAVIPALVRLMNLGKTDVPREAAVVALERLARDHDSNRIAVASSSAIASLTRLIYRGCTDAAEEAATLLLANLAGSNTQKQKIVQAGAITPLLKLVEFGETARVKDAAANTLKLLADHSKTRGSVAKELDLRPSIRRRIMWSSERKAIHERIDELKLSMMASD
ncbi:hypothetical protein CTAYLR_003607 [Chrysophaeum taylorii]|uniref:RING-type E3 ubiquitin transferase n=1 Tax=Chrysophaeum taylorii TaxID=2483200 RepID=A0AAD7UCZ2_9STRA|nr:hypothetical protein CTAYLR_003607 [Chrysophaeum taylorii]